MLVNNGKWRISTSRSRTFRCDWRRAAADHCGASSPDSAAIWYPAGRTVSVAWSETTGEAWASFHRRDPLKWKVFVIFESQRKFCSSFASFISFFFPQPIIKSIHTQHQSLRNSFVYSCFVSILVVVRKIGYSLSFHSTFYSSLKND